MSKNRRGVNVNTRITDPGAPASQPANNNGEQPVDLMNATAERLRPVVITLNNQVRVMRDEARMANDTITTLRVERLGLVEELGAIKQIMTPAMLELARKAAARTAKK